MRMCACARARMWGQRTTWEGLFFPSTLWASEIKLRWLDLAAGVFYLQNQFAGPWDFFGCCWLIGFCFCFCLAWVFCLFFSFFFWGSLSLFSPGWPWTQQSSCLKLWNARIIGMSINTSINTNFNHFPTQNSLVSYGVNFNYYICPICLFNLHCLVISNLTVYSFDHPPMSV